jgi:hypothetical protein
MAGFNNGLLSLSAGNLQIAQVTLNTAAMTSLYSAPTQLVAAPGAGLMLIPLQFILDYVYNTTAFTIGISGNLFIQYDSTVHAGGTSVGGGALSPLTFVDQTANMVKFASPTLLAVTSSSCINKGLYISQQTADMTGGGTSSMIITIPYYIISAS